MSYNKISDRTKPVPSYYKRAAVADPRPVFDIRRYGAPLEMLFKVLGVKMKSPRQRWTYRAGRRNYALGRFPTSF